MIAFARAVVAVWFGRFGDLEKELRLELILTETLDKGKTKNKK